MAPKQLLEFPVDIQRMIVGFVVRPTDQVALCLTCKHLHELTVPSLYKCIDLDLGGQADEQLPAFLNPANIGLKHIREVELYLEAVPERCNQLRQAAFAVKILLEMLPRDQLEIFRWHPWDQFSAENMALLCRKQRRLKWFGSIGMDKPFDAEMEKRLNLDTATSNVRKVGLYPDSRDMLEFSHAVLKRVKNPDKITMHCNLDNNPEESIVGINDTPTEPGLLTSTVFRHMLPFHKCEPMRPRGITLEGVNLRYCTATYCSVMDFSKVQKLNIRTCTGTDALFAALCSSSRLPEKLVKLEVKHDEQSVECETTAALDTFLCLVSGIKTLTIDIGNTKRLITAAGITRHAKTLQRLVCHAWKPRMSERRIRLDAEEVFEQEAFDKITKACTCIQQLSLAFRQRELDRMGNLDFDSFSKCLKDLPNLVTINATTFPHFKSRDRDHLPRKLYENLLGLAAQEGFDVSIAHAASLAKENSKPTDSAEYRSPYSKLKVISWGISDKIFDRADSEEIFVFVRGAAIDPMGGPPKCLAQKMSMKLIHYWERKTDILSVPLLNRVVVPPTAENEEMPADWE